MKIKEYVSESNSKRFEAILDFRDYLNDTPIYNAEYSTLHIHSNGSAEHQLSVIDLYGDSFKIISRNSDRGVEVITNSSRNVANAEYRIKCSISDFNRSRQDSIVYFYISSNPSAVSEV